jgi:hypothetical protein
MGDVALSILDGEPWVAEKEFGCNRSVVMTGIKEDETVILCVSDLTERHKPRTEEKTPELFESIQKIMEPQSQADPQLHTTLQLYEHDSTIGLRCVYRGGMVRIIIAFGPQHFQHSEPPAVPSSKRPKNHGGKKTAETDAIFENVNPETLRISIDTKATIQVGKYS